MVLKGKIRKIWGKPDFSQEVRIPSGGIPNPYVAGSSPARRATLFSFFLFLDIDHQPDITFLWAREYSHGAQKG